MADEAGFLELLVANERVGRWLDILMDPYQRSRHKYAIAQLQQDLQRGSSYVEEAIRLGVAEILTKLLAQTSPGADELRADEKTMDAISRILAVCSGPMACGGKVSSFSYGDIRVSIREGALGDGLGAKVWSVCHIMCRELVSHPEIFKGQQVLELGSGTGLVGLVAALAGAEQVVLTDYEEQVVTNLRTCMHMNTPAAAAAAAADAAAAAVQQQQQQQSPAAAADGTQSHALDTLFGETGGGSDDDGLPDDADLFDDAESVDDIDFSAMLTGGGGSRAAAAAAGPAMGLAEAASKLTAWEAENMCVRNLDWQESADALHAAAAAGCDSEAAAAAAAPSSDASGSGSTSADAAPGVPLHQRFAVILGNEVMYELQHAKLVAAAIRHRLTPGGRALLCCAVRDQAVFDMFRDSCRAWGLRYRVIRVQPEAQDLGGIKGRESEYEGGYLLMAVDHAAAPAADWHRDDFVVVE